MKKEIILNYFCDVDYEFKIYENSFVTFLGNQNKNVIDILLNRNKMGELFICNEKINGDNIYNIRKKISFVLDKNLDIWNGETVADELSFGLEGLSITRNDMIEIIQTKSREYGVKDLLIRDPNSLGSSDKAIVKILNATVIKPKIIVLDNILSEIDPVPRKKIVSLLKEYIEGGGCILNFTSDIEESLYGDKIIIISDNKVLIDGKTLSVLNEEKIMKRLGYGLPFIVELNKYFMDYGLINKYELDMKKLVNKIWK